MYPLLDAVTAYATLGEIITAGREIFGTFKEPQIL
jgi:methylmalonyl-CoA mutase N-terminal domain/subunit